MPELSGSLAYLRCRRAENFVRYDHTILIGDLEGGRLEEGAPAASTRAGGWTGSCSRCGSAAADADHLQPPRQRAVGELGLLLQV